MSLTRRTWFAAVGAAIVGVLLFYGLQMNPSEAQAKDFPGKGDAIAGRQALAAAGISAGVMKPFVVPVQGGDPQAVASRLPSVKGVSAAVAPPAFWPCSGAPVAAFPPSDGAT